MILKGTMLQKEKAKHWLNYKIFDLKGLLVCKMYYCNSVTMLMGVIKQYLSVFNTHYLRWIPFLTLLGWSRIYKGLIILLHSRLACSKAKDSMNIFLTSGADTILFTAELNLCKKSVKPFRPCIILLTDSDLFPDSSNMSQEYKVAKCLTSRCDH